MAMTMAVSPSACEALSSPNHQSDGGTINVTKSLDVGVVTGEKKDQVEQFKAMHASIHLKGRKFHRKRRHSTTEETPASHLQGKHRRQNSGASRKGYAGDIILPNKFLLGGNICDPLNLNSMLDENVNKALNAVTPSSSPLPPRNSKISIVIPNDMTDPLGLNKSTPEQDKNEEESQNNENLQTLNESTNANEGLKPNHKKRKRRRKSQHEKAIVQKEAGETLPKDATDQTTTANQKPGVKPAKNKKPKPSPLDIEPKAKLSSLERSPSALSVAVPKMSSVIVDPIVSPVIPQDVRRSSALFSPKSKKRKSASITSGKQLFAQTLNVSVDSKNQSAGGLLIEKTDEKKATGTENVNERINCEIKTARLRSVITDIEQKTAAKPNEGTLNATNSKPIKVKPANARFQYGNYSQYYGYRNPQKFKDIRMNCLKKDWFKDKDVLDVGCNAGHLTLLIARDFSPRKVVGVDIDGELIKNARKNIRHYATSDARPIVAPPLETGKDDLTKFPNNILFLQGNYVPEKDEVLQCQEPEYDIIMCMSVSKWVHLNWGDEGLMRTFQRFYKQLRPGGKLILEPQEWKSYGKKKKLTEKIYQNYNSIKLRPDMFPDYLVKEIGFEKVEYLAITDAPKSKGFQRPMQLYYKPE